MTEDQIKNQVNQAKDDAIVLDYPKWSQRQIINKLPNDHDLWIQKRDAVLSRQQSDNADARRNYNAQVESARTEKQKEADAELDQELEPQKQMLMRDWLANNPGQTAADFEKKAWGHLRANLIEKRNTDIFNATMQEQAASGRYSL